MKELKRVKKNAGKVLVIIPNDDTAWKKLQRKYDFQSFSDPDHKIEYTPKSIKDELEKAGLRVSKILPHSYDTPWIGFIDLVGGVSLSIYKRLSIWRKEMAKKDPKNCAGFLIIAK